MKTALSPTLVLLAVCLPGFLYANDPVKISGSLLGMMEARSVGPAVMGGRITAIDAVNSDPRILYVGTAGGGIWKSTTGGSLFKPIFDKYIQSIGAIAIDQNHPEVVWAGTGESNMRNSVSIGNGLYKSEDGGNNWIKTGLDSTEHISRIVIDPRNSNVVYVAAPGPLFCDSPYRGLYKTTDGGKTWENILFINNKTGCAEVLIDPKNPSTIYASTWEFRRTPYSFSSGGKGSGVFKSLDGGKTWSRLTRGLPAGEFGRVAMALAPSEPSHLFAIVESKHTSLFLSTDGGNNWKEQSSTNNVAGRPFYFSVIAVDPSNPKRVYRPAWSLSFSDDGGLSFSEASFEGGWVHSDHHALWINPNNTSQLYLGTDGGVYMSLDKGNNWFFLNNIPVGQFYHAVLDDSSPYNVAGGLQDNGSWIGPSQSIGGIQNGDWKNIGGGDGFWVQFDKNDKDVVYTEYQGGHASRINRRTNEFADIQPQPGPGDPKLRFNWSTPIYLNPVSSTTMYMGSQFLYRSYNKGVTWKKISPDLTTNDPKKQQQEESGGVTVDNSSAENHCTIFTIAGSPLDSNMIFVGTDDGNLQFSPDGGTSWKKINPPASVIPPQTWVSGIEPSRYDKNTIYATFDNHMYGDMNTYCAVSNDLGLSWRLLTGKEVTGAYAHCIREDLVSADLLFLGTEAGLWISLDRGLNWTRFDAKVPPVAVRDIRIHPQTNDLVLATHGRSILIVDDISPLRQLNKNLLEKDLVILKTRPVPVTGGHYGGAFPDAGGFVGQNSSEQAVIMYYLKDRITRGDIRVEVFDKAGKSMGTVPATKRKGLNIISWSMRMKPPRVAKGVRIDRAGFFGPLVDPGTYTVRITKGDNTFEGTLELINDPASPHSPEDRALQKKTSMQLFTLSEDLAFLNDQVLSMKESAEALKDSARDASLKKSLTAFAIKLEKIRKELVATTGGLAITGEERIREKLSDLYAAVISYEGRPSDSQLDKMEILKEDLNKQKKLTESLWATDLPGINAKLKKTFGTELQPESRETFNKSEDNTGPAISPKGNFPMRIPFLSMWGFPVKG